MLLSKLLLISSWHIEQVSSPTSTASEGVSPDTKAKEKQIIKNAHPTIRALDTQPNECLRNLSINLLCWH
jgi:hypothetical protein